MTTGTPRGRSRGERDRLITQHIRRLRCIKCESTRIAVKDSKKRVEDGIEITLQYVQCSECNHPWKREIS